MTANRRCPAKAAACTQRRPIATTWATVAAVGLPFLVPLLTSGCGQGLPATAPVSGKVTWQGKPVTQGKIGFYPDQGVPAFGEIQPDGSYTLTTFKPGDGAVPGRHRVTIESRRVVASEPPPQTFAEEIERATTPQRRAPPIPQVEWLVPERYAREVSSGLTANVAEEANQIEFKLPE